MPEEVKYLVQWAEHLRGRSGLGFSGVAPLSFTTIKDWAELMQIGTLHPLEIDALLSLDAAMFEKHDKKSQSKPNRIRADNGPWPTKH